MGLFSKKKDKGVEVKAEKPNRFKIENQFSRCRDSIDSMLEAYDQNINLYMNKIIACKQENKRLEADRYLGKLKQVMYRKERMAQLYDQIESFEMMINEAFAKNDVYQTLGTALNEVNKGSMISELQNITSDMQKFEKNFTESCNFFDHIFDNVGKSINSIDLDTSNDFDDEISAIVNDKVKQLEETTLNVDKDIEDIDNQLNSL